MSLPVQVLTLCAASLALGLALLGVRGVPTAAPAGGEQSECSAPSAREQATEWISVQDARAMLADPAVTFVDCRPRPLFVDGHIAGALSLPSDARIDAAVLSALQQARTLITYCDARSGCESSSRLAARLHELGMRDVRVLAGGLPIWLEQGFPAESGTCPLCPELSE